MAYEQRYTLREAAPLLESKRTISAHILVFEKVDDDKPSIEHVKITVRATSVKGALQRAMSHITTEMEIISAEAGSEDQHTAAGAVDPYPGRDA
jgi:hypothetical protein